MKWSKKRTTRIQATEVQGPNVLFHGFTLNGIFFSGTYINNAIPKSE